MPLDADDYFAQDYVRLAAQVLDTQPHVGMVYAYGCLVGAMQGSWLAPCTQEELIFNEGVPAPSMYRKTIWQAVGGYHDYMYHGREDWDFSLSVMEKGWKVHALSETPGIYYRIKSGSRSSEAEKQQSFLLMKIYENHKALFLSYPQQVAKMFCKCYALRRYYQSQEFILGNLIVKPIAKIRDFVHYGIHWIKDKWMGRKMI